MKHPLIEALASRRIEAGLSQSALARRIYKSARAVSHFESDPGGRQLLLVEEVARGLGLRLALVPIEDDAEQLEEAS
ncbi:helix-turn-helix transcriptional regulator [Nonomuraea sp. NPDC049129]|uniref:helix-turn-helix domain-containing protein n=1 Tax=Nonomuraea sp. NPDC049129 TaxID=3155272 RepID=UPI0033F4D1D4